MLKSTYNFIALNHHINDHNSFYLVSGAGDKWRRSKQQRENSERDSARATFQLAWGGPQVPTRGTAVAAFQRFGVGGREIVGGASRPPRVSCSCALLIANLFNIVLCKDLLNNTDQPAENS